MQGDKILLWQLREARRESLELRAALAAAQVEIGRLTTQLAQGVATSDRMKLELIVSGALNAKRATTTEETG